ncbi:hypothetical protein [Microbulbifer discodermiae]|uniref:hypothetical protein n=1 Tax=Microbulbifer sp. 2201CG32-9 TaxID=3232309 RepID=UPI00345B5762
MKYIKFAALAALAPKMVFAASLSLQSAEIQRIEPCLEPLSTHELSQQNTLIEPDPCDPGGGGGGPYGPPSTPASITYPAYTNTDSIKVSWAASYGNGYPVTYELYESKNNGGWVNVYTGSFPSRVLSNKTEGKYRYRVLAKNSSFSSSYRYGNYSLINPRQESNLYLKYPTTMSTLDSENYQFRTVNSAAKTELKRDYPEGQSSSMNTDEGRFHLGNGFDLVRGSLKETCLNVNHPNFVITQTPASQSSTFDISYVNDNRHLAQLLDVSSSAQIGFSSHDFDLGLSGEQERYVNSVSDETYVRYVVKIKNRRESWNLSTPVDAIHPALVNNVLSPNDDEAKADFRERCGDNYISSANIGSALYLVFKFSAKAYSYQERENKKAELGLAIGDVFQASGAVDSSSSLTETLDRLNVEVRADQIGGPPGVAAAIALNGSNVVEKYNQFVQDSNSSNWSAVDYSTNNYQRPTVYNAYAHNQIFADYTGNQGPLAQMRRWLDISVQHRERCDLYGGYDKNPPSQCHTSIGEISTAMDLCLNTRSWGQCVHPHQYNTGSLTTTAPGTYLLGWLSTNVKKLNEDINTEDYDHHVYKSTKNVDDRTCLKNSQCFLNPYRGSGPGIGKGFHVFNYYYDNPRGGSRSYSTYAGYCARTQVYLDTGNWFLADTTADWEYSVTVEGLCPETEDFLVIP